MTRDVDLVAALDLQRHRFVHLIGGGGKTTLMTAAARALAAAGRRVIATTSTRIRRAEGDALGKVLIGAAPEVGERARASLSTHTPVVLALAEESGKLLGFPAESLEQLAALRVPDVILVEADGAAGRPLKAHEAWEPVIAPSADLVIAVVGAWCLGQPLDGPTVHRAPLFADRTGSPPGTRLTTAHVAAILFHERGYLAKVPRTADVMVAVTSRTGDDGGLVAAIQAADERGRVKRVVLLDPPDAGLARVAWSGSSGIQ